MKLPHTFDLWIGGLLTVAVAALVITSVGTFEFFSFILPGELAFAATVVLAAGIPLLKFAHTFDRKRARGYMLTLGAFLAVELIAQYFKAQASFAPKVAASAALRGSDLAVAAQNAYASRVLAFVFLASLPFVVVVMSHAAAERLARRRATFARIRGAFDDIRAELRQSRAEVAPLRAEADAARAEVAQSRATLAQYEGWLRQARAELERERSRPVLTVETALTLLIEAGAVPESTARGWRQRVLEGEVSK